MHDIDRTQLESGWEVGGYNTGEYEYETYRTELGGYEVEFSPELYGETYGETFNESYNETYGNSSGPLGEADEMELAVELLEVMDEAELDQFIGGLFKKVTGLLPRGVRNSLGGLLKGVAKKFLPVAGSALGNLVAPGVGGAIGSNLASAAGRAFGLELEGLSPEDQEFEVARQIVRTAGEAVQQAAQAPAGMPPQMVAQRAFAAAAQKHAPGLMSSRSFAAPATPSAYRRRKLRRERPMTGRWERNGNTITLHDI